MNEINKYKRFVNKKINKKYNTSRFDILSTLIILSIICFGCGSELVFLGKEIILNPTTINDISIIIFFYGLVLMIKLLLISILRQYKQLRTYPRDIPIFPFYQDELSFELMGISIMLLSSFGFKNILTSTYFLNILEKNNILYINILIIIIIIEIIFCKLLIEHTNKLKI